MRGKLVLGIVVLPLVLGSIACSRSKDAVTTAAAPTPAATATAASEREEKLGDGLAAASAAAPVTTPPAEPAKPAETVAGKLGHGSGAAKPTSPTPAPSAASVGPGGHARGDDREFGGLADGRSASGWAGPSAFAGVKAGEWDDNANYREFNRFLASSTASYRRVNLENRRFLVVRDQKGLGIPRCKITVTDTKQARTSFITNASGRAILFPHAEGMNGGKLSASADCAEGKAEATFATFDQEDAAIDLKIQNERRPIGVRAIDVAFVLDTTGSMSEEIQAVKATIQKVAKSLSNDQTTVRIGLVEYKDRTDPFVTKVYPFSGDLIGFSRKVEGIHASGGGDLPEDMNAGLHAALTELSWNNEAVARLAFVIADAPPHLDYPNGADYAVDMKTASHRGIQLFTVSASGMDGLGQVVMRQMAQFTGGTNMFVLRGGAGPQSTGGGDPGSSCGGTHTNYSSGKLDELIVQKIRRELRAIDADPMRIAGLTKDENAKPCDERVVFLD